MRVSSIVYCGFFLALTGCSGSEQELTAPQSLSAEEIAAETAAPLELKQIQRDLVVGASGADVRQAHRFFLQHGYFKNSTLAESYPRWSPVLDTQPSNLDEFGNELEAAIAAYQERYGLPVTGAVDHTTLAAMGASNCAYPDSFRDPSREKWAVFPPPYPGQTDGVFTYRIINYPSFPSRAAVDAAVAAGLATWTGPAAVAVQKVTSGAVDLQITWTPLVGEVAHGNDVSIQMNSSVNWVVGPTPGETWDIQSFIEHEFGHTLGLDHSTNTEAGLPVMWAQTGRSTDTDNVPGTDHPRGIMPALLPDDRNGLMATTYASWFGRPGLATEIGAGGGAVWITGTGAVGSGGDFQIFRRSANDWLLVDGGAVKVAIEPNQTPWVINKAGNIYRRNGVTTSNPAGTGWSLKPGSASDIAIGSNGTIYKIGTDFSGGDASIAFWNGSDWTTVSGGAKSIAVDSGGIPWVVNSANVIYRRNALSWEQVPGLARDIAAGPFGAVWITGTGVVGISDFEIWSRCEQCDAANKWVKVSGGGQKLAVDSNGQPWLINSSNVIWQRGGD